MWSVTEQNHLHYPGVMFHCFRLVHWWLATHSCACTSLLLLPHVTVCSVNGCLTFSVFLCICRYIYIYINIKENHWFQVSSHPSIRPFILPSIHPSPSTSILLSSVRAFLHHLSLVYVRSFFFLSFRFALRCCHMSASSGLTALCIICTSSSQFCRAKSQLLSVIFSFLWLILSPLHFGVFNWF